MLALVKVIQLAVCPSEQTWRQVTVQQPVVPVEPQTFWQTTADGNA